MRAWVVKVGEPIPLAESGDRLFRTGTVARILSERGHGVIWWSSTFSHANKKPYFPKGTVIQKTNRFRIRLIQSRGYKTNVSLDRFRDDRDLARGFRSLSKKETKPDVILCSFPTPMLAQEVVRYARLNKVPVLLDVRDMWPDIILWRVPKRAQWLGRIALRPLIRATHFVCENATALTGITPHFVSFACDYGHRQPGPLDEAFHLAYEKADFSQAEICAGLKYWSDKGVESDPERITLCYFGAITKRFAFETVIQATRILDETGVRARFVVCGTGDALEYYADLAKDCPNILFAGWANGIQMVALAKISDLGLAPYFPDPDFQASFPNKFAEYLANGLPVVSSLNDSYSSELLTEYGCGIFFDHQNPQSLAAAITRCWEDRNLVRTMAKRAPDLYEDHFRASKVYGAMCDRLEQLAKRDVRV